MDTWIDQECMLHVQTWYTTTEGSYGKTHACMAMQAQESLLVLVHDKQGIHGLCLDWQSILPANPL